MQNQSFLVIYQGENFMVDPQCLYNSSKKFRELVDNASNLQSVHLMIKNCQFSTRNIENFLKICQNIQTDVQDSELEEISLIAKMFQAEQIYNTGLNFIQANLNANFSILNDQFNPSNSDQYLQLESDEVILPPIHHVDLNELNFDENSESVQEKEVEKNNNVDILKKTIQTSCYQITCDNHLIKCCRYYLMKDGKIICMAKQKDNEIYIGEGQDIHISKNKIKNTVTITRNPEGYNIVSTDDQEFKIKYLQNIQLVYLLHMMEFN